MNDAYDRYMTKRNRAQRIWWALLVMLRFAKVGLLIATGMGLDDQVILLILV